MDHIRSIEELGNRSVDIFLDLHFIHSVWLLRYWRIIFIMESLAFASIWSVIVNEFITSLPVLLCEDLSGERISQNINYQQVMYIVSPADSSIPVEFSQPHTCGRWIVLIGENMPAKWRSQSIKILLVY